MAGAAAGGLAVGGLVGGAVASAASAGDNDPTNGVVAFRGAHQAGIATAAQDRLLFVSFDVVATRRTEVAEMLQKWTVAAERLTQGLAVDEPATTAALPPTDTGEAVGLHPARLTLTFGFGPTPVRVRRGGPLRPGRGAARRARRPPSLPG